MQIQQLVIDKTQIDIQVSVLEKMIGYAPGQMSSYEKVQLMEIVQVVKTKSVLQAGYLIQKPSFDSVTKSIGLIDDQLSVGGIIFSHLKHAQNLVFMACTIGHQLDQLLQYYKNRKDYLAEFYADIIGSAYVESLADFVHRQIELKMRQAGLQVTNRFSPGYCGWSVAEQNKLFKLAPDGFAGIHLTNTALMQPMKSISAIIGIGTKVKWQNYNCQKCEKESCLYHETQKLIK